MERQHSFRNALSALISAMVVAFPSSALAFGHGGGGHGGGGGGHSGLGLHSNSSGGRHTSARYYYPGGYRGGRYYHPGYYDDDDYDPNAWGNGPKWGDPYGSPPPRHAVNQMNIMGMYPAYGAPSLPVHVNVGDMVKTYTWPSQNSSTNQPSVEAPVTGLHATQQVLNLSDNTLHCDVSGQVMQKMGLIAKRPATHH